MTKKNLNQPVNNCCLLYNEHASGFKVKQLNRIVKMANKHGYHITPIATKYPGYIEEAINNLNTKYDYIFTMGGDGTVGEAYRGFANLQENGLKQQAIYAHIPSGTTNDMGKNTGVFRYFPYLSLQRLLKKGTVAERDILKVNNTPIAYIAATGIVAPVTYLIDDTDEKKDQGTLSYIKYGIKAFFQDPELCHNILKKPYQLSYQIGQETKSTDGILVAIFSAKSFAHLDIDPTADMNDGKFEVVIVRDLKDLFRMLGHCLFLFPRGVTKLKNTISLSTKEITIHFDRTPFYSTNCDGDKALFAPSQKLQADMKHKIKQLVYK